MTISNLPFGQNKIIIKVVPEKEKAEQCPETEQRGIFNEKRKGQLYRQSRQHLDKRTRGNQKLKNKLVKKKERELAECVGFAPF